LGIEVPPNCVDRADEVIDGRRGNSSSLSGGAAASLPLPARAQRRHAGGRSPCASSSYWQTGCDSAQGMNEAGYVERPKISRSSTDGRKATMTGSLAGGDMVDPQGSVILAMGGTEPARAAKAATSTIPIIFAAPPITSKRGPGRQASISAAM